MSLLHHDATACHHIVMTASCIMMHDIIAMAMMHHHAW